MNIGLIVVSLKDAGACSYLQAPYVQIRLERRVFFANATTEAFSGLFQGFVLQLRKGPATDLVGPPQVDHCLRSDVCGVFIVHRACGGELQLTVREISPHHRGTAFRLLDVMDEMHHDLSVPLVEAEPPLLAGDLAARDHYEGATSVQREVDVADGIGIGHGSNS